MTDIWCRRMDCKYMMKNHRSTDNKGSFGYCNYTDITISKDGVCEDYEKEGELVSV